MHGRLRRSSQILATIVFILGLGALPGVVRADGWNGADAAQATAGRLEDHKASSRSPDEVTAESRDPGEMLVESETFEGRQAQAGNPASMLTNAQRMDQHEGTSTSLTDLREAAPGPGFEAIEASGQSTWGPTTDPEVLVARQNLLRAEKRAAAARTAYGDARHRDYPRGEARVRIVNERDAAMKAFEEAKRALAAAE